MGVCVRAMTIRSLRIEVVERHNGHEDREVAVPGDHSVPVPQTILSDEKIDIKIKDGMYDSYTLDRKSEVYGLVHAVGGIPGAFVQGVLGGLGDSETLAKKEKDVITAQKELREAKADAEKSSVTLQNAAFRGGNAYGASITTVYPFPASQKRSLTRQRRAPPPAPPLVSPRENDFTDPPTTPTR